MVKKLKPFKGKIHLGCLNCSTARRQINMRCRIWGQYDIIKKNGQIVYLSVGDEPYNEAPTLMKFENMARKEPNCDWRYWHLTGLHDELYQRHGRNYWPLVKSGLGYA